MASKVARQSVDALAKHRQHVIEMRQHIDQEKRDRLIKFEKDNKSTIKDLNFKPGDLVLVRHTEIESSLDKKWKLDIMDLWL